MARLRVVFIFWVSVLCFSCGKNQGTPNDDVRPGPNVPSSDLSVPTVSKNELWRLSFTWETEPRYSDEDFLEMRGRLGFLALAGSPAKRVESVVLRADMPQHGHGTGNVLPMITATRDQTNLFQFHNLFFTMPGVWKITVTAQVDGAVDQWVTEIKVK